MAERSIYSPFDRRPVGTVPIHTESEAEAAIDAAARAFPVTRRLPAHERYRILRAVHEGIADRAEEFAQTIVAESGKTIRDARAEVGRALLVLSLSADESRRQGGDLLPLDLNPASEGRVGLTRRFPIGPVAAITPFNFPLNLVAHKVGPALAVGSPVVLKPAEKTPLTALLLAEVVWAAGWPREAFAVLTPETPQAIGEMLATDERLPVFSFTGSDRVGWELKAKANRKRVLLELGGNAGVIVEPDADPEYSVRQCVTGSFANAGQVCISVQRIFLHQDIFSQWTDRFMSAVSEKVVGDPSDERTDIGPMIHEAAADTAERHVRDAIYGGATVLLRGKRLSPTLLTPTVLINVNPDLAVCREEIFAPIVVIEPYADYSEALARVNDSRFGLQAGVFTHDVRKVFQAFETLQVGGVIANDVPQYRVDNMPYGGVRDSGVGREGVRYAIEEITEERLLVLHLRG
ncbi:MAG: aldehyde dehydrogenase family protein [Capsulimonadales bacterium]|nr:aldehyde dehydrogenase family protein [Capsulimonadales bacterium]